MDMKRHDYIAPCTCAPDILLPDALCYSSSSDYAGGENFDEFENVTW